MESARWTLDELVSLARRALVAGGAATSAAAAGPPNGRVRELPDRRTVRWYTTIGLVDRPLSREGRIAWYGERHLCQVVAVKRLQATGQSLAEIQAVLAGASEEQLSRVAQLTEPARPSEPGRARFWASPPLEPADASDSDSVSPRSDGQDPRLLTGVPLPGGALLLLPAVPNDQDLVAIRAATRQLTEVLRSRNLIAPDPDLESPAPHRPLTAY